MKTGDIISHIDDKEVNTVDEVSKLIREKKDNLTVRFQLTRNGKKQNIEVKMPVKSEQPTFKNIDTTSRCKNAPV
ncbi:MAG: PDZ domain-containing protein [Chitinophagaceae bacterium]|nr:PDZ domain-containing protein [Chitinophagaceae bacterium]